MSLSGRPFDDFRDLVHSMPDASAEAVAFVRARDAQLTKPAGALGRLEEIVQWLAAWQAKEQPTVERPTVVVFAGNHGVVAQGVSAYPGEVTRQMVASLLERRRGGEPDLRATFGAGLKVFEMALDIPTKDITQEAAMTEAECAETMAFGMEAIHGVDLLCLGEMGIGNTTPAAAVYAALYGGKAADWVGRGTGVDDAGLKRKIDAVERALALHRDHLSDLFEILRRIGGREIVAICGAILAARMERTPVVLDGYVVCAAAAILHAIDQSTIDPCMAGHLSPEGAHADAAPHGQASCCSTPGDAARRRLLRRADGRHHPVPRSPAGASMATFESAGVSEKA